MFWNVTLHSLSYLTDRDFYFEKRLDGSAQSPLMHGDRERAKSIEAQEAKLNRTLHSNSCAHDMTVPPPFWTVNFTKTP